MKFLIVGLGSMGKRRIRNLQALQAGEIIGLDPVKERRQFVEKEYGVKTVESLEEGLKLNPDAFVISTPPDKHMQFALVAAQHGKHFFIEASVVLEKEMVEVIRLCKEKELIGAPSCTMRFKQAIRKIKELVDANAIGKIVAFTYHMGQYLPDWHPWEDISKFYVGKKLTGAAREMVCFETEWLTWVFGDIDKLACMRGKFSSLPVDIDDVYGIIYHFNRNIIGSILIDVVSRTPYRVLKIIGEEGTITWDWNEKVVHVYTANDKKHTAYPEQEKVVQKGYWATDDMYIDEMRHFVNAVIGKDKYMYSLEDDKHILQILLDAENSSDEGKHIKYQ